MSYPTYILSYTDWKAKRTALAGTTYYLEHGRSYVAIVVSKTAERVEIYRVDVIKDTTDPNLTDFELNIKPTAIVKISIANIMSAELVSSGGQESLVRVAFGAVPAAYGVGAQIVATDFRNILQVRNNTDQPIIISLDGVTDSFYLGSGEVQEYTGVAVPSGSAVQIRSDVTPPSSGEVIMSLWSDA